MRDIYLKYFQRKILLIALPLYVSEEFDASLVEHLPSILSNGDLTDELGLLTCVREYVSFQMVAASERSVAVIADEVLLDFQWAVIVHVDGWK